MDALLSIGRQQACSTVGRTIHAGSSEQSLDMAALGKQAESLWKMLDEMAENDPQAYGQFIKQQAEAAAAAAATPAIKEAAAVVLAQVADSSDSQNLCLVLHIWPVSGCDRPTLPADSSTLPTNFTQPPAALHPYRMSGLDAGISIPCARVTPPNNWLPPASLATGHCAALVTAGKMVYQHQHVGMHPRLLHMAAEHDPLATGSAEQSGHLCTSTVVTDERAVGIRAVLLEAVCQAAESWLRVKLARDTCRLLVHKAWLLQHGQRSAMTGSGASSPLSSLPSVVHTASLYGATDDVQSYSTRKPSPKGPLIQEMC